MNKDIRIECRPSRTRPGLVFLTCYIGENTHNYNRVWELGFFDIVNGRTYEQKVRDVIKEMRYGAEEYIRKQSETEALCKKLGCRK